MKRIITLLLVLATILCFASCSTQEDEKDEEVTTEEVTETETEKETEKETEMKEDTPLLPGYISYREYEEILEKYADVKVEIYVKDMGKITAELYPEVSPVSVKNFVDLADDGFYNGIIFHRVINNFMIQAGDPTGTGYYGSGKNIFGEFSSNGYRNTIKHERGVLSMARGEALNSASSQFFICHQTSDWLDGDYAAFGKVIEGMDVVDAIAVVETNDNDKPLSDVVIEKIEVIYAK